MILAADVGGSKTLLGLFERGLPRPRAVDVRSVATLSANGLPQILREFLGAHRGAALDVVSLGVAGPILGGEATLTNVPWRVRASDVVDLTGVRDVRLLNDLEAMAHAVPVLTDAELATLQRGTPVPGGPAALIAAGTGLGEAVLHVVGGRMVPLPSEAGHSDFAARTDEELALVRSLRARFGRVDIERVVSGRGLANIAAYTHDDQGCVVAGTFEAKGGAAAVSAAASARRCPGCERAMAIFVSAYGAEAGNLALRAVATGGVYVGGGIAPKILDALRGGAFLEAFADKAPMTGLLEHMPVHVILNDQAALLGAAVAAQWPASP